MFAVGWFRSRGLLNECEVVRWVGGGERRRSLGLWVDVLGYVDVWVIAFGGLVCWLVSGRRKSRRLQTA